MANILVYIELIEDRAAEASLQTLLSVRLLASELGATLYGVLPCSSPPLYGEDDIIAVLSRHGADKVILMTHPSLSPPTRYSGHGEALLSASHQFPPALLFIADTTSGRDMAPRVAVQLGAIYLTNPKMEIGKDRGLTMEETALCGSSTRRIRVDQLQRPSVVLTCPVRPRRPLESTEEAEVVVISPGSSVCGPDLVQKPTTPPSRPFEPGRCVVVAGQGVHPDEMDRINLVAKRLDGQPAVSWDGFDNGLGPLSRVVGTGLPMVPAPVALLVGAEDDPKLMAGISPKTLIAAIHQSPKASIRERAHVFLQGPLDKTLDTLLLAINQKPIMQAKTILAVSKRTDTPASTRETTPAKLDPDMERRSKTKTLPGIKAPSGVQEIDEVGSSKTIVKEPRIALLLSPFPLKEQGRRSDGLSSLETAALHTALQISTQLKAKITTITVGPKEADAGLKWALSRGVDRAVRLWDRCFEGADYRGISRALATLVKEMNASLVIAADRSERWGRGIIGPAVAHHLEMVHLSSVISTLLRRADKSHELILERCQMGQSSSWRMTFPCLITVARSPELKQTPLKAKRRRKNTEGGEVEIWDLAKAGLSSVDIGPLCRSEGVVAQHRFPGRKVEDAWAVRDFLEQALKEE